MNVVLYIFPEQLSVYELSHGNARKRLDCSLDSQELENLREYLRSRSARTRYQVIVDMPGDVVIRRSLPRVSRAQQSRLIDGMLAKNLGHLLHRTGLLSVYSKTQDSDSEVRLCALGDSFANSTWYSLLADAGLWIAGLYTASLLTEVALIPTVRAERRLLLCTRSGAASLRFLYFDMGELLFTRVTDFEIRDRVATLQQIESTRQYVVSEFSQQDEFSLSIAVTPDIPLTAADRVQLNDSEERQSALDMTALNNALSCQFPQEPVEPDQPDISSIECMLLNCVSDAQALRFKGLYRRLLLRYRIAQRNCNSANMRNLASKCRARHLWRVAALNLTGFAAVLCIVFSASGVYLSTQTRVLKQIEADWQQDLEAINTKLVAFDHDAFMMRDSVVIHEFLKQRFNSSVDLLLGLAEIFDQVNGIVPTTLSWSAATTEATHRKLLPDAVEIADAPDVLQVQLIGFLTPTYQTAIEGYLRYEQLLEQISTHDQFTLQAQERKPFVSARESDRRLTAVDDDRSEFTLLLEFVGG